MIQDYQLLDLTTDEETTLSVGVNALIREFEFPGKVTLSFGYHPGREQKRASDTILASQSEATDEEEANTIPVFLFSTSSGFLFRSGLPERGSKDPVGGWEDILALPLTGQDDCDIASEYDDDLTTDTSRSSDAEAFFLQRAYQKTDTKSFSSLVDRISWCNKPAWMFKQAIDMALELEDISNVRKLAKLGHELHPTDENLRRAAHVFAPPKIVSSSRPPKKGLSAFMSWFEEHAQEYRGNWVAVKSGQLLATAASRESLVSKLEAISDDSDIVISPIQ